MKATQTKLTQREIARMAGVSPATVSMALRGTGSISDTVRARIVELAAEAGYDVAAARYARPPIEPTYVTMLEYEHFDYQWYFIKPFLLRLTEHLMEFNCYPILFHVDSRADEAAIEKAVLSSRSRVVCTIHYYNEPLFRRLKDRGIPVIVLNNNVYQSEFSAVCVDDYQGVYNGVGHLVSKGHRNILFVDYPRPDFQACVADRYNGFRRAAEEFQLPGGDGRRITLVLDDPVRLTTEFHQRLEEFPDTTAIVFHDDYLASWAIPELRRMGIRIPHDISIIAPGDTLDFDEPFTPRFDTIRIDTGTMGKLGASLVRDFIENRDTSVRRLHVTPTIVERGSCRDIRND